MQVDLHLNKSQCATTSAEMKRMQNVPYASVVRSIMYVVRCTRPYVAFAQNITSRFQQNPGEAHWTANCKLNVIVMLDSRPISQTGYVFVLNGGAAVWKSFKQSTTAQHTTEAEYIAASETAKEAV
ncbi:hypothetical protein Tco_0740771 [Tanacetum coccineum]